MTTIEDTDKQILQQSQTAKSGKTRPPVPLSAQPEIKGAKFKNGN